jgi:dienelactone hydrolase
MLLAANGSIIRGFVGVAILGVVVAWLAGHLCSGVMPRLVVASRAVGALVVVAGIASIVTWMAGMDRRDVEFVSQEARLTGTLMLPTGVDHPPVAVIVHGSALLGRDFYAVWGRHLVREGIGVFVYDKRGTGSSDGVVPENNNSVDYLTQLGRDASAAFSAVQSQPGIDARRVSMIGISQGGWTVPVAASLQPGVFRLAFLSGPVATTNEERAFSEVAGDGGSGSDDHAAIQAGDRAAAAAPPGGFDPVPHLTASQVPGRWFFGDRDRSIPVTLSRQRIAALRAAGKDAEAVMLAGADHLLFGRTSLPIGFSTSLMPQLAAWLRGEEL